MNNTWGVRPYYKSPYPQIATRDDSHERVTSKKSHVPTTHNQGVSSSFHSQGENLGTSASASDLKHVDARNKRRRLELTPFVSTNSSSVIEIYSPVASRTINPTSNLDKLPAKVRRNIFRRCDLRWTGEMPAVIVAMRISPVTYGDLLRMFYKHNAFTLHEGNNWSMYGMSKYALATIRRLEIIICTCHLTDGSSKLWLTPHWYSPANTGAVNVRRITLSPSHAQYAIPPDQRFPISPSEIHNCLPPGPELKRFIHKFPYYLTPFKSLSEVRILFTLLPWALEGKEQKGCYKLSEMLQTVIQALGVKGKVHQLMSRWNARVEVAQMWQWKVDEKAEESMDWSRIGSEAMENYKPDWEDLIEWDGVYYGLTKSNAMEEDEKEIGGEVEAEVEVEVAEEDFEGEDCDDMDFEYLWPRN